MTGGIVVPVSYGSQLIRLESGELLPVIIGEDGVPPLIAHLYTLHLRTTRRSALTLHKKMQRLAELYGAWESETLQPLERALLAGAFPDRRLVEHIFANAAMASSRSTALARCGAWAEYFRWVADEENWWPLSRGKPPRDRTRERIADADSIAVRLQTVANSIARDGGERERNELVKQDLGVIRRVFGPRRSEGLSCSPFQAECRLRNWLLFSLVRHTGIRIGEALMLKLTSLPRLSERDIIARQFRAMAKPQRLSVERSPDDPDNPRKDAAVKRGSRQVIIPDAVAELWWLYVDGGGVEGRPRCSSPYVFVTKKGAPLSTDGADYVIERIARFAALAHTAEFGEPSRALEAMTWHSLRHYRAVEALAEFFPDDVETAGARAEYLTYFGWSSMKSALPYLRRLSERTGHRIANTSVDE